jgi:hypothetical protein
MGFHLSNFIRSTLNIDLSLESEARGCSIKKKGRGSYDLLGNELHRCLSRHSEVGFRPLQNRGFKTPVTPPFLFFSISMYGHARGNDELTLRLVDDGAGAAAAEVELVHLGHVRAEQAEVLLDVVWPVAFAVLVEQGEDVDVHVGVWVVRGARLAGQHAIDEIVVVRLGVGYRRRLESIVAGLQTAPASA